MLQLILKCLQETVLQVILKFLQETGVVAYVKLSSRDWCCSLR